ncbi:MAG: hypothetical protein EOO07_15260 [Chitinophagaceae bacterium]|nr:MAG: hypothetical protein EOO07_15260 [Chitinophagaceae bacterium]
MSNQFRSKIEEQEEELPREEEVVREPIRDSKTIAFLRKFFTEGVITKESATDMLPFLIFVCVLVMIYIANSHMAISNIRKISTLNKEVKELSWEYKSLKADLMFKSKLTEVAKKVDTLGIKELIEPPKKIIIKSNEH